MKYDRLLSLLKQANSVIVTLTTTCALPDGRKLGDLDDDEFEAVVVTVNKFRNSLQLAFKHLALLRRMQTQARAR